MKNKFLQVCVGLAIVLCATAFLIKSIAPAQAEPTPANFINDGTNKIGTYMMNMIQSQTGNISIIVWNTETGKSVYYYYSDGWKKAEGLPENPLAN